MSIEKPINHSESEQSITVEVVKNPNSIGEVMNLGNELLTSPDKVYRSVRGKQAVDDLFESGVVRNAQSAGKLPQSRWGERVFWSRGAQGKHHNIQEDGYVIEAPYEVAAERQVRREDVTAIYTKTQEGGVEDILKTNLQSKEEKERDTLNEVRARLGIHNTE